MGTSGSYGGPGAGKALIPSWLPGTGPAPAPPPPAEPPAPGPPGGGPQPPPGAPGAPLPVPGAPPGAPLPMPGLPLPPARPPIPAPAPADAFTGARGSYTRFAGSGGRDRGHLGRSVSRYISTGAGGSRQAAQRMGSSRVAGERLLNVLSDVIARGPQEALRTLDLDALAGRPIDEIFLGLADQVCPDGGTVDEGIAREAFFEMIADLATSGVTDFNALTVDQMGTVFELYATHAIEGRLHNDIGMKAITIPPNVGDVATVQAQLRDFIRRGVSDALVAAREGLRTLTPQRVRGFVNSVYERAFEILHTLGDAEAEEG